MSADYINLDLTGLVAYRRLAGIHYIFLPTMSFDIDNVLASLTSDEKIALLTGQVRCSHLAQLLTLTVRYPRGCGIQHLFQAR